MTDTSSLESVPSSVVCPLAKLGRLSPCTTGSSYSYSNASVLSPNRPKNVCAKLSDYKLSSVERVLPNVSYIKPEDNESFHSNTVVYSPTFYYREPDTDNRNIPAFKFYENEKREEIAVQTAKYHSPSRTSPYLDQGYHTLIPPSPSGWSITSISKFKNTQSKPNYFDKLSDNVILLIFSYLNAKELCLASRVCRQWYCLAWHQSLWKSITLVGEKTSADKAIKSILRRLCGQDENGSCPCVKQLSIYEGAKITDKGLVTLSRRCSELTRVQLQNCSSLTDSALSELVSRCPYIRHLDITGCSLLSTIYIIPGVKLLQNQKLLVQYLDLTDCLSVQDSSLRTILQNCPHIIFLYLRRCNRITDAGVKVVPSFCSSLRELSVSDCILVTDFALYELAKLGSSLRYLSVAKCSQVSDVGLKIIAKRCYKLRYLNVRGCEAVSDDALTAVARSCPRLRSLDVGKCDISDAGLKILAENCPNLKKLSIRNCDLVTDRGIQFVCYYCRGLQQLNIQDCQISYEGYKAVKRFCKRCIIEHTNPGFF